MATSNYYSELGSTGLNQWGGYIKEEFLRQLQGPRGKQILREMADNDDTVGACLYAIEYFARQVDWRVESDDGVGFSTPNGADRDEKTEFVRQCLFDDMSQPWSDTVAEALSMLVFGFSLFEIVYKRRVGPDEADPMNRSFFTDGRIGWRKWAPRAQETIDRWEFDDAGGIKRAHQISVAGHPEAWLPIEKCLLFRTTTRKSNPEGRSILRNAFRSWQFKRRIQEYEGIGIERDLAGIPKLKLPESVNFVNPNDPNIQALLHYAKSIVTSIRNDDHAGVVLPFGWDLDLLGTAAKKQFDTNAVITRYDQRIAMSLLADFILIGHDAVGSKALNVSKLKGFSLAMTSFLDHIQDVVNRIAIPRLFKLNGWPIQKLPKIKHGEVEDIDLAALADYVQKLSSSGMPLFPNPGLEAHLLSVAKLPVPEEGTVQPQPKDDSENPDDPEGGDDPQT
jgi:hypothetical protein